MSIPNTHCVNVAKVAERERTEKEKEIKEGKNQVLAEDQRVLRGKRTRGRNIGKKEGIKWD